VQSELGTFTIPVDLQASRTLKPKEHIRSTWMEKTLLYLSTVDTYRVIPKVLEELMFTDEGEAISPSTLQGFLVSRGKGLYTKMKGDAMRTLEAAGYDPDDGSPLPQTAEGCVPREWDLEGKEEIISAAEGYNKGKKDTRERIKDLGRMADVESRDPDSSVKITIDGVLILKQKEHRGTPRKGGRAFHEIVNVHIRHGEYVHAIPAKCLDDAMAMLTSDLVRSGLMDRRLVFITDGQRSIATAIERNFGHIGYDHYIDWYHLRDTVYDAVRSDFVGTKDEKEGLARKICSMLWAGNPDDALEYITGIPDEKYRKGYMGRLTTYIENKKDKIPCFALRKLLGLHTSSNEVEMTNDEFVSTREKGKGMSWSHYGGLAIAAFKSLFYNETIDEYIEKGSLPVGFVRREAHIAAA